MAIKHWSNFKKFEKKPPFKTKPTVSSAAYFGKKYTFKILENKKFELRGTF